MPSRTALLIGNSRFPKASERFGDLPGALNDVHHIEALVRDQELGRFDNTDVLLDRPHHEIRLRLYRAFSEAARDDLVLIWYSGHGTLDADNHLCLCAHDTESDAVEATSVALPDIRRFIHTSRCSQIVFVLDCCYSGAATRGLFRSEGLRSELSMMRRPGLFLLTSTNALESASESLMEDTGRPPLGRFTECFIQGIRSGEADIDRDGVITVGELSEFLAGRLGTQTPTFSVIGAQGQSPVLAWNAKKAEHARLSNARATLSRWLATDRISIGIYRAALECLASSTDTEVNRQKRSLILRFTSDKESTGHDLATAWRYLFDSAAEAGFPEAWPPFTEQARLEPRDSDLRGPGGESTGTSGDRLTRDEALDLVRRAVASLVDNDHTVRASLVRDRARELLGRDSESFRYFARILKDAHAAGFVDLRGQGDELEVARVDESPAAIIPPRPSAELDAQLRAMLSQGKKIQAIKLYGEVQGVDLKEAKDVIDAIDNEFSLLNAQLLVLLSQRKKIQAIKLYREVHRVGLKDAKDAIDTIDRERLLREAPFRALLSQGKKIQAIKLCREVYGLGLKDAKDVIDAIDRERSLPPNQA